MINPIQNIYHFFKYGRIVHRSPNGNVIRKKLNNSISHGIRNAHVATTKTILDKEGNIDHQIKRTAYVDEDIVSTTVKPVLYNSETCEKLPQKEQPRAKSYLVKEDEKILTDNTKPGYDYKYEKLPNGKAKYTIAYPETTVINKKNGEVKTTMDKKEYIV